MLYLASTYYELFGASSIAENADGSMLITSAPSRYAAWAIAFPVILAVSQWCRKRKIAYTITTTTFYGAFIIPFLVLPGMTIEHIRMDHDSMDVRTGLWFYPTCYSVSLSGLTSVVAKDEPVSGRSMQKSRTYWYFNYASGKPRRVWPSDLLVANRAVLVGCLRKQGVTADLP
ncbi:MAG: hypothetical protein V4662_24820 [Verrucomicrobiota bacterium]